MIKKSGAYRVVRVATGRVLFTGNKTDAKRECRMANEAMGIADSHRWERTPHTQTLGNNNVYVQCDHAATCLVENCPHKKVHRPIKAGKFASSFCHVTRQLMCGKTAEYPHVDGTCEVKTGICPDCGEDAVLMQAGDGNEQWHCFNCNHDYETKEEGKLV